MTPTTPPGSSPGPSWRQTMAHGLHWRGADGLGFSLAHWLLALAVSWLLALLWRPVEPALILVPPMLGLAILIPGVQALLRPRSQSQSSSRVSVWLARLEMPAVMVIFAGVGFGVFGQMWQQGMVIDSGDHQFMMGRAEIFYEGLRHGHWQHWTHLWQGGDTLTDLYPIEANLITAVVHLFAPRGTPFVVSYTVFVLWAWWLRGVGVYYLARRFSTPLIAFVLAYASLFDVGKDVNGGVWFAAIYFGMIHNTLALTFGLFATALQVDLTRKVTSARLVACALLVALSACGHALGMLVMAVSTFALGVAVWMGRGQRREALWALGASCLGLALSAVWLLPFSYALKMSNYRVAGAGSTFADLGKGMFDGSQPTSSFVTFFGLLLIAAVAACLAAEIPVVAGGIASMLLVILVLTQFMVGSRLLDYFPALLEGQPPRMLTAFKTTVIPCAAWLLQGIWQRIPAPSLSLRFGQVMRRMVVLGILVYGIGRVFVAGVDHLAPDLRGQVPHNSRAQERTHTGGDYQEIFAWLKNQRRNDASPIPWRVAILWRTEWRHATWAEGMNTGVPVVDPNSIPSNFFSIRPREISARGFNDWNVRYAVTDYSGPPFPGSVERFSAGRFHIWEVEPFDARYVIAPPGVTVSDLKLEGESIRFRVDGAPPEGVELQLRTAAYPRWRARQNGRWLEVGARLPRPEAKPKQEQLVIHAGNGPVVITCDGTLPRYWLGLFVTLLAMVLIPLCASVERRDRFERWLGRARERLAAAAAAALHHLPARRRRRALAGGVGLLVLLGLVAQLRGARQLFPTTIEGLSEMSVRWRAPDGQISTCLPVVWSAQYMCNGDAVVVDNWLGTTGPGDDSNEGAALWPGIRVVTHGGAGSVILRFGRVRLDAPRGLWLQTAASGAKQLKVTWGDLVLADQSFDGEEMHQFSIPPDAGGTRALKIEIRGNGDATLLLRGGGGPAPRFR